MNFYIYEILMEFIISKNKKLYSRWISYFYVLKLFFTGVSFPRIEKNAEEDVIRQIPTAMDIFARGVEAFLNDPKQVNNPLILYLLFVIKLKDYSHHLQLQSGQKLIPNLSCEGNDDDLDTSTTTRKNTDISQRSDGSETKWALGETFHR